MLTLDWTYPHIGWVERYQEKTGSPPLFRSVIPIEPSKIW